MVVALVSAGKRAPLTDVEEDSFDDEPSAPMNEKAVHGVATSPIYKHVESLSF